VSVQSLLTTLLLPPLGLILAALLGTLAAWRGRRAAGLVAAAALLVQMLFATPQVAGWLRLSLERRIPSPPATAPLAIVVLSGDVAHGRDGVDLGPLTLERMRIAASLHRDTGLPILVTGGVLSASRRVPVAELMRAGYAQDFAIAVRWVEAVAGDTRGNAQLSARMLRQDGIDSVWLVTHAWHLPRAAEAFARAGLAVHPAPVRLGPVPVWSLSNWVPNPRAALDSWYFLREWVGILVYRLHDR
jgi:uncharacterized SAM-binding protein YcdF (DUF218 family)